MKLPIALVWLGPKSVEINRPDEGFCIGWTRGMPYAIKSLSP